MRGMIGILLVAAVSALMPAEAVAKWVQQTKEDPFNGDIYLAFNASVSGYVLGFRCSKPDDLTMILMTPEKADEETVKLVDVAKPHFLVIIDKGEKRSIAADAALPNSAGDTASLTFSSSEPAIFDVLADTLAAKTRLAVAVEVAGLNFHSNVFDVSGTSRVLGGLVKSCGLSKAPA